MDKTKIYIVSWYGTNDVGGLERVTQYMIDAWQDKYDIDIIDFAMIEKNRKYINWLHKHYVIDGIVVSLFAKQLQKKEPNAKFVTQGYNAPFIRSDLAFLHGTMRGYKIALEGSHAKWHMNQLYEKWGMKNAKCVVAVGRHVKDEAVQLYHISEAKIEVIENCVDSNTFFPVRADRSKEIYRILFVGRLEIRKGLQALIELAKRIENSEECELHIAVNSKANVELFKGFQNTTIIQGLQKEQMNEFYNKGSVMYFPSLYEGFEMVTMECLSAGVPVIGNDVGAVGDLYARGQEGVEILSSDIRENLRKMKALSEQYKEMEMRQKLHEDIKCKYDLSRYKEKLGVVWERFKDWGGIVNHSFVSLLDELFMEYFLVCNSIESTLLYNL